MEKNRGIQINIIKLNTERTWISPTFFLVWKMAHCIIRPTYMDTYLCHVLLCSDKTFSHKLEIETNGYACKAMEEQIRQLCHYDQELEELYAIFLFRTKILPTPTLQGNVIRNLSMLMTILVRNQETEKLLENKMATNLINRELSQWYLATITMV